MRKISDGDRDFNEVVIKCAPGFSGKQQRNETVNNLRQVYPICSVSCQRPKPLAWSTFEIRKISCAGTSERTIE